jgi:hypothetical protein
MVGNKAKMISAIEQKMGYDIGYAIRCVSLHFILGIGVAMFCLWLTGNMSGANIVTYGLIGGLAGTLIDLDHLLNYTSIKIPTLLYGRPLHVPIAIAASGFLAGGICYSHLIVIVITSSLIVHLLEDWLIGWF